MIIPVILCGGAGVRLWPLSRESLPKQFLPLVGGRTTFAMTLERIAAADLFAPPLIVANEEHRYLVTEAMRLAGIEGEILLEPTRRDSAAAVAAAAALAAARDPGAVLLILAADHVIRDAEGFRRTVRKALPAAESGHIVTFGITPEGPTSRYGYIERGGALADAPGIAAVAAFREKPDAATAAAYIAAGHLWNSGNFMMRAGLALAEMRRHAPEIAAAAEKAVAGIREAPAYLKLPEAAYGQAPATSFDRAVMEKTDRAAVIEAGFDWRDLGSFEALSEIAEQDAAGNSTVGEVVAHETRGSYVHAGSGVVALLGVDDLIVARSEDAVLVAARDRMDSIRDLVEEIGRSRPAAVNEDRRVVCPWGHYEIVCQGGGYQAKRVVVEAGARLSLQKHARRAEHWVVVSGTAEISVNGRTSRLGENQSAFVPLGGVHRLANPGNGRLVLIEVQYGDYLGEDDIERFADDYDRLAGF